MRWGSMRLILIWGLASLMSLGASSSPYAAHREGQGPVSLPFLLAAEQSLSDLVAARQWQRAVDFGEHFGDATHNSAHFYQLLAHSYSQLGYYDKALDLLRLGQSLYPAYGVFSGEIALLYASRGSCDTALRHWQAFSSAFGGQLSPRDEEHFARFCPFASRASSGASLSWQHSDRALTSPDRQVLATQESVLGQFCRAFEGFCPRDNRFTLPHRTAPTYQMHLSFWHQTEQLRPGGHLWQVSHHQSHSAPPLGQAFADLQASWRFSLSANLLIHTGAMLSMQTIPRDGVFAAQTRQIARAETGIERRGKGLSHHVNFASSVGRLNETSFHADEISLTQMLSVNQALTLITEARRYQHRPAQSDLLGPYVQHDVTLDITAVIRLTASPPWQVSLSVTESDASYQKTLPYLTQPHQVRVRNWEVQMRVPWAKFPRLSTVMALRHMTSNSSNSLQNFTGQSVNFGLQWR